MYQRARRKSEAVTTICVSIGRSPPSWAEDPHEDRDEEEEHADEDERRERQHHDRVHHRALHAALDLRLLLDLVGDTVEHDVQDSGRLAGLDHGDEEPGEDARVSRHRLGEQEPPSTSARSSPITDGELLVLGLLLEDDEGRDDVEPGLDHRRELAREDLQRLRLDLLDGDAWALPPAPRSSSSAASSPRTRSASRAAETSGALISPVELGPVALIAVYAKDAILPEIGIDRSLA